MPLRSPHVGAMHIVLVGSRPDQLGSDLIQIEERIRMGSIVCGNFGGASLTTIQARKKLASLTAVTSAPEGSDASASTAHIFTGPQLEVRGVIRWSEDFYLAFFKLVVGMNRYAKFREQPVLRGILRVVWGFLVAIEPSPVGVAHFVGMGLCVR